MQSRQETIRFKKARSATTPSSSAVDSSGLVETGSGTLHYVSKSVNFGVRCRPDLNGAAVTARTQSEVSDNRKKGGCGESTTVLQTPPRGETRHVYLDMQWAKFGFRLQVSACTVYSALFTFAHFLYERIGSLINSLLYSFKFCIQLLMHNM